jgi:fructose-specific component phosphotransferase system IIB-like protein
MIKKSNLFKEENLNIFTPDGIEFIHFILANIGYYQVLNDKSHLTAQAREDGLKVVEILCDMELIEVFHWGQEIPNISKTNFEKTELIAFLRKVWKIGTETHEFDGLPMFIYKKWYLDALEKKGLTIYTNWKKFVEEEIGDLEQWIEEVRPK